MADDILMINNPHSNSDFDLLWPTSLITLECEVTKRDPNTGYGIEAIFLDATFSILEGKMAFQPYNKLVALNIRHYVQEYTRSNSPLQYILSALRGHLIRLAMASSSYSTFTSSASIHLARVMREAGVTAGSAMRTVDKVQNYFKQLLAAPFIPPDFTHQGQLWETIKPN